MKAKICWVEPEDGGRASPPTGPRYVTVVRFKEMEDKRPNEAWSLIVEFRDPPDESLCMTADVRFLVPEAPHELLRAGSRFELLEGVGVVARGEVL